jgi:predicted metal-dependent hydrolase
MDNIRIDKIVRSRRRTLALIVTPEARVIVRAPLKAPAALINDFVKKQQGWIQKKVGEMKGRPQVLVHAYEEGEIFWFLGRAYPLHIVDDQGQEYSEPTCSVFPALSCLISAAGYNVGTGRKPIRRSTRGACGSR